MYFLEWAVFLKANYWCKRRRGIVWMLLGARKVIPIEEI
jgi:hypothetical protein